MKLLELKGCIVTIDAMGCQTAIADLIIAQEADYVLALKGNQGSLHEDVQWLFEPATAVNFVGIDHDFAQTLDKGHGRLEIRRCWTLAELDYLEQRSRWRGLSTLVMVQRECREAGKVSLDTCYFISSLPPDAKQLAHTVRSHWGISHWGIENSLHWVLDVSFCEDACRIRKDHAPENFGILRHRALNLLSKASSTKRGMAARRKKAAWDDRFLIEVLTQ
jgi:predicted transposase YbfD/YdcC